MMMQKVNNVTVCVNYTRNIKPTFHDIGSPVSGLFRGYTAVEPTGNFSFSWYA